MPTAASAPPRCRPSPPRPDTRKGRLRAAMEAALQDAAARGMLVYPGPLDRAHAWAQPWEVPHALDGDALQRALGPLPATAPDVALHAALGAPGFGAAPRGQPETP